MRKLGDRCDDNKGVRDKDECGQKMRDGEYSPLLFFFLVGQLCFLSLPRSGNGSGDECHRCAASAR